MPNVAPLVRAAMKYGPVAYAAGRKAYERVEPQVRAYRLAQQVDGYVVDWPAADTTYHVVLDAGARTVVDSFPPAPAHIESAVLTADAATRTHYRDHWVHEAKRRAKAAGETVKRITPGLTPGDASGS